MSSHPRIPPKIARVEDGLRSHASVGGWWPLTPANDFWPDKDRVCYTAGAAATAARITRLPYELKTSRGDTAF